MVEYYENTDEVARLRSDQGFLEFERTQGIIRRVIDPPPARVADVGGGPGVYAAWLAQEGYDVTLVDPIEPHVHRAQEAATAQPERSFRAIVGDARALELDDTSQDAVLLLGPLYHLVTVEDRLQALREAARVLRPGGVVVAAAISRFASLLSGAVEGFLRDPEFRRIVEQDLRDGQHRSTDDRYFTTAYFHRPDDLRDELSAAGFVDIRLLAVEGPYWMLGGLDEWRADAGSWRLLLESIGHLEAEPSLLGASAHILGNRRPGMTLRPDSLGRPRSLSARIDI